MVKWYELFFDELVLDLWRCSTSVEQTAAEVEMLEDLLDCGPGTRLLDLASGPGRHAIELARKGCRVTAVDLSPVALEAVRRAADTENLPVQTVRSDLAALSVPGHFAGAYCLGNSFGYLDAVSTVGWFGRLAEALDSGAGFLLHTGMAAESLLPNLDERNWVEVGDYHLLLENDYNSRDGFLTTRYTIVHGTRREIREARHCVFTVAEIGRMLNSCGLEPIAHFASCEQEAFDVGDPDLYLLARRRSDR